MKNLRIFITVIMVLCGYCAVVIYYKSSSQETPKLDRFKTIKDPSYFKCNLEYAKFLAVNLKNTDVDYTIFNKIAEYENYFIETGFFCYRSSANRFYLYYNFNIDTGEIFIYSTDGANYKTHINPYSNHLSLIRFLLKLDWMPSSTSRDISSSGISKPWEPLSEYELLNVSTLGNFTTEY